MVDVNVLPYRVEWRPYLTARWGAKTDCETREGADERARAMLELHGGYCRLISQHVIEASERPGAWEAPS